MDNDKVVEQKEKNECIKFLLEDTWIFWFNVSSIQKTNQQHSNLPGTGSFSKEILKYQENNISIDTFDTIESFWACWKRLQISQIPSVFIEAIWERNDVLQHLTNIRTTTIDKNKIDQHIFQKEFFKIPRQVSLPVFQKIKSVSLFRKGVQPIWEDPKHLNGGMFFVKIFNNSKHFNNLWKNTVLAAIGETFPTSEFITGVRANPKKTVSSKIFRIEIWFTHPKEITAGTFIQQTMEHIPNILFANKKDPLAKNFKVQSFGSINYEIECKKKKKM